MSQERWDVVLRFIDGPLSYQGDLVCRGPVVRMGASPGPGGLLLDGYRGLDNRQAVITAYDGGTVAIAPVGTNQVRVAPHENVDWTEIQTLRGPVHLSPGSVFHLGAPGRGATISFIECRRLGVWKQRQILSEAAQVSSGVQPVNIESLNTKGDVPRWFIPALLIVAMLTVVGLAIPLVEIFRPDRIALGPVEEGKESYDVVKIEEVNNIEETLLTGMEGAFDAFVVAPNARAAKWEELHSAARRDDIFFKYVVFSMKQHAGARSFWSRLGEIHEDYAYVTEQLTKAELPTVFAAIPYRESGYRSRITSPVCAEGWWQFMPETGRRVGLEISDCKLRTGTWSPTKDFVPRGVLKNAEYVLYNAETGSAVCLLKKGCVVDERQDLARSTDGALNLLREAWEHPTTQESGSAVQITILSHNAGFDDSVHDGGRPRGLNMLTAYGRHLQRSNQERAPDFYGANILCDPTVTDPHVAKYYSSTCGGLIPNQTQHYGYSIVAQHLLAVCFYAKHFPSDFPKSWQDYWLGDGYCQDINVPEL